MKTFVSVNAAISCLLLLAGIAGAEEKLVIRQVEVKQFPQMQLQIGIVDENGNPVKRSAPEIKILENGREIPFTVTAAKAEVATQSVSEPISLLIVWDTSGSFGGRPGTEFKLQKAKEAAKNMLSQLVAGDRVALMTFDSEARLAIPFGNDISSVMNAIENIHPDPNASTALFDAATEAAALIGSEKGKRAVVFMTDGMNTSGRYKTAGVALGRAIEAAATPYYTIGFGDGYTRTPYAGIDENSLKAMAKYSAGEYSRAEPVTIKQVFQQVKEHLDSEIPVNFQSSLACGQLWESVQYDVVYGDGSPGGTSRKVNFSSPLSVPCNTVGRESVAQTGQKVKPSIGKLWVGSVCILGFLWALPGLLLRNQSGGAQSGRGRVPGRPGNGVNNRNGRVPPQGRRR